jgi:cytochrome c-type biogenesis protein CcmH/NrfG
MDADTVLIILLTALGAAALPVWAWWRSWRRLDSPQRDLGRRLHAETRLEQVERALETLAAGQAQLAESCDFLLRILSGRLPPGGSLPRPEPPAVTTPH